MSNPYSTILKSRRSPGLAQRERYENYARQNVFNARRSARELGRVLTGNSAEERQYAAAQSALDRQRRVAANQPAVAGPGALRPSELRDRISQVLRRGR